MELLQVLNRDLPSTHKVLTLCHKKTPKDISDFLLHVIKSIKKNTTDIKMINLFCIQLYDMIYYDIMFDKVKISKKILRILEELAVPIKYIGEEKRKENLQKIKIIKAQK